jgi:hypothetical protein
MTLAILELESSSLAPLDSCQKQIYIGKVTLNDTFFCANLPAQQESEV